MATVKLRFISKEHEEFYNAMLKKSGEMTVATGLFSTAWGFRKLQEKIFACYMILKKGYAESGGLHGDWQTVSTKRLTYFALNLWNGYTEPEESMPTFCDIFDCEYAPYFYEAIKLRYPEYCWDLSADRNESIRKGLER